MLTTIQVVMGIVLVYISGCRNDLGFHMYVCLCHGVSDKKIRKLAIEDGVTDIRGIKKCTALGSQCGKCVKQAKEVLAEASYFQLKRVS